MLFSALDQAAKAGDPAGRCTVQAVKQSMDPYGYLSLILVSRRRGQQRP